MKITKDEQRILHPHKFYGYKCGMLVNNALYTFLGYADKGQAVLADKHGNRLIVFLNEIF